MNDKWHIYKGNKELGVMTAEEIRAGLRDGTLDPFDMVAREGSQVRREIFEVDEIFSVTQAVYDEMSSTAIKRSAAPNRAFDDSDTDLSGTGLSKPGLAGDRLAIGGGQLHLATSATSTVRAKNSQQPGAKRDQSRRQRNPKQYYLTDRDQKSMGPLSIDEIRSLFYRGVLPKDVKVMREGSTAQVSVSKFLSVYMDGQQRPVELGGHPRAPRYTSQISRRKFETQSVSPLAIVALFTGFLLLGAAAVLIWETKFSRTPSPTVVNSSLAAAKKTPRTTARNTNPPTKDETLIEEPSRPSTETRLPIPAPPMLGTATEVDEAAEEPVVTRPLDRPPTRPAVVASRPVNKQPSVRRDPRQMQPKRRPSIVTVLRPQTAIRQRATPAVAMRLSARPPLKPMTAPRPGVSSGASIESLADGTQVQNLGPMSFDRNALTQCAPACTLTFNGATGSVRGTFFKKVWGPALERSSGSVYLSGSVRKSEGGTKIILNGVK